MLDSCSTLEKTTNNLSQDLGVFSETVREMIWMIRHELKALKDPLEYLSHKLYEMAEWIEINCPHPVPFPGESSDTDSKSSFSSDMRGDETNWQQVHRPLLISYDDCINAIIEDISNYSGEDISWEKAEEIYESIKNYTGFEHSLIRSAYNNADAPVALQRQMRLLDGYVQRVPKWQGKIYRGINMKRKTLENLLAEPYVDMLGPSSWSSSEEVADCFARNRKKDGERINTVFVLEENSWGASITHLSTFNGVEKEVLVPSGCLYQVEGVEKKSIDGIEFLYIFVHEYHDPMKQKRKVMEQRHYKEL